MLPPCSPPPGASPPGSTGARHPRPTRRTSTPPNSEPSAEAWGREEGKAGTSATLDGQSAVRAETGATGTMGAARAAIAASMVTKASACSLVTARYSASNVVSQPCSSGDPPGGSTRHSVPEETHLHLGQALVALERHRLRDLIPTHAGKQETEGLRADEVRGDQLMPGIDLDGGRDEVEQRRCVDHIASHVSRVCATGGARAFGRLSPHFRRLGHPKIRPRTRGGGRWDRPAAATCAGLATRTSRTPP